MVHPQEMMDLYAPGISLGLKKQSPGSYYRRPFNPLSSPSHVACTTKATSVCFLCGGVSEAGDSDVWESRIFFLDGFLLKTQFPVSLSTLYADYLLYSSIIFTMGIMILVHDWRKRTRWSPTSFKKNQEQTYSKTQEPQDEYPKGKKWWWTSTCYNHNSISRYN
ncbi:unnamed protein product [Lactuca virosa]|uniref:Uncharacterized protein n=1 Tax=Lactuca virosa TaxID=75947 RepID=A0AAU9P527_9ASTR|nr:unnamed protein product [Lactuca virosa]